MTAQLLDRGSSALDWSVVAREVPTSPTSVRPGSPVRTCIGCRRRSSVSDLVRVVADVDTAECVEVVVDLRRKLPGRGAWLHLDPDCLAQAERRRAFGRALRVIGTPNTSGLTRMFESSRKLESFEGIGSKPVHEKNRYTNS